MLPEDNIDDLFRRQLDGHETPPGDDLWARLQNSAPQPEANDPRLDELFQKSLGAHSTAPRRELWERLEDEHLRPRQRRAAAWWPMAMAAAVLILLLAGGAGLWLGFPAGDMSDNAVATGNKKTTTPTNTQPAAAASVPAAITTAAAAATTAAGATAEAVAAANNTPAATKNAFSASIQKNTTAQATRSLALASTASKAQKSAERPSPRHPLGSSRQPDAAAPSLPLVARTMPPAPARNPAADEQRPAPVVAATTPTPVPAPEIVPARLVPAAEFIAVEVRNGAAPARPTRTVASALAANPEPAERRRLGGRLLHLGGQLVRGERVSLAEVTGLPENVTIEATVAGHRVTKSIQL
ncbi:hypothetical protein ACFP2F_08230 [Hymenobacter artigasi]|uniref:FecR protein domain-containing protein n=1 Tax=Hymenobacter artigasi TaxID=2719616 RepID=A0ABX1HGC4_9BACT|nr:hypothetical protein [Hymenobacter artigasi]NKI89240.1 hypothetical protein [Hymenobacter artigasi]